MSESPVLMLSDVLLEGFHLKLFLSLGERKRGKYLKSIQLGYFLDFFPVERGGATFVSCCLTKNWEECTRRDSNTEPSD